MNSCTICWNEKEDNDLEKGHDFYKRHVSNEDFPPDTYVCYTCATSEALKKRIDHYKPMMQAFSKLVNNCSVDHEGLDSDALVYCFFNEHRYLQNEMIVFLIKLLTKIGKHAGDRAWEDPRNQWGLAWARKDSQILSI